ncbi:MAG TPA: hypothetical protein PKJ41_15580 [Bryobacteraceae bacterium]|nr:hypothetical protein [Bryobacteraceae bacterium]HPT25435.1 hypothetical protein [Bryobacteraceae bacterium]
MDFLQTLMPDVHHVLGDRLLTPPPVLEIEPVRAAESGGLDRLIAAGLPDGGAGSVKAMLRGQIRVADVLRKPSYFQNEESPKFEPFGLLETMPASYAGVMFGIAWLLLLISAALGYLGRRTTTYTANDPATWDPKVRRPLAAIVFEPSSKC